MDEKPTKEIELLPIWCACVGIFNSTENMSRDQNEQAHYRKHVIVGQEWDICLSIDEYRSKAKQHLNSLNHEDIIELCQVNDLAVVKYNIDTGELGIARRDDGYIKTFFRPNNLNYIINKLELGIWGDPYIEKGWLKEISEDIFDDDESKEYLYDQILSLSLVVPTSANELMVDFFEGQIQKTKLSDLIASLGAYRFYVYEIQQKIMSEEQIQKVFSLRKKLIQAEVVFEIMEKNKPKFINQTITEIIHEKINFQEKYWPDAIENILDAEDFDCALVNRDNLGFLMTEVSILQLSHRLTEVNLTTFKHRLKKSDLYCRRVLSRLARSVNYQNPVLVAPENFFWRRIK